MLANAVQRENAIIPMAVSEEGSVIEVRPLQPVKAEFSMTVGSLGRGTDVRPVQLRNAFTPMDVSELGKATDVFPAGQVSIVVASLSYSAPSNDENIGLPASTLIFTIAEQLRNTISPIVVSEAGRFIDVRLLQYANTWSPRVVSELDNVADVSPEHLRNAPVSIVVMELGNSSEVNPVQTWNALRPMAVTVYVLES